MRSRSIWSGQYSIVNNGQPVDGRYGAEIWHETHPSDQGLVIVVVQSLDGFHLFAASVKFKEEAAGDNSEAEIIRTVQFDLAAENSSSDFAVFALMSERNVSTKEVQAIRPVINFDAQPPQLTWEIELRKDNIVRDFSS